MPLLSKTTAIESLRPYLNIVHQCITGAWEDYSKYPDWTKVAHDQTTRANIINNHMILRATAAFMDDPRIKIIDMQRQSLFVFDSQISLRLKKLDADLMPQNVVTKQVKRLNGQKELEEIKAAYHLVAGYTLSTFQTKIDGIYLVCPNNKRIYWELEITNEDIVSTVRDLLENIETEEYGSEFEKKEDSTSSETAKDGTKDKS